MSNTTSSYIQAGAALLAAALRDPAPILDLVTIWDFMKVVQAAVSNLTEEEKTSSLYQEHVRCYDRIYRLQTDMTPVGEDHMQLGELLIEALAAYAEQAASLLPLLLERCDSSAALASLQEAFTSVMERAIREIEEVPGGPAVQQALTTFKEWAEGEQVNALRLS
ncbi:hypothetical protein KDA_75830 [Dictyobacter alpinus]|uniref:Uncharacterized protein n=1 Tax=Dictyobacter alpinus TaxID=2014873 RepID=A0A402BL96_9CHLR|nr:hypothetical protein [Dictyobacter alpinus]GCE32099.1 hypothetical protein KDA_75830 [Dictyobacter alpinus]